MTIATRVQYWLARRALKAADIAFLPSWVKTTWLDTSFTRLTREGYKKNAAVNICLTKLALAYQQPPLRVLSMDDEPLPDHPLQALINRPNPLMSWRELAIFISTYKAIGGNTYLWKQRAAADRVVALWPLHAGQVTVIPGATTWIDAYEYDPGDGDVQRLDRADIVHLKWPTVDPDQPWQAMAPLTGIAREVDTDNEASRYQYALLFNDATPRTAITLPAGQRPLIKEEEDRIKASFRQKFGGDNRGDVAILANGAGIERLNLNMQELAFDALRRVPEARISAAFLIPAEYSGLTVGLEHSTYNNVSEARRGFFEDTIVQLCALDAGELESDLAPEFGGNVRVEHDFRKVVALQENEDAKHARAVNGWDKGLLMQNEGRRMIGLPDVPNGDIFKPVAPAASFGKSQIIDVQPIQRRQIAAKASPAQSVERRMEKALSTYLRAQYTAAAEAVH